MSVPDIVVRATLERLTPNSFVLNSATNGVLDTNILGGFVSEDVLIDIPVYSMSINRGRSRQLDRFTSGTATIVFDNRDRLLDPLNTASTYADFVVPRVKVKVFANDIPVYSGFVTDWDIEYSKTNADIATVYLADNFTLLAGQLFDVNVTPVVESCGDRLQWVVDEVGYLGNVDFDDGSATLGAYQVAAGTSALDYMLQVQQSDSGFLFVSADDVLKFVGRFGNLSSDQLKFSDDGVSMPYQTLSVEYGDDLLYNRVLLSSPAGSYVAEGGASVYDYGLSGLYYSDLLNSSVDGLTDLANRYLARFSEPKVRFTGLSLELAGLSDERISELLNLELVSNVVVVKSFVSGTPSSVTQDLIVSGIAHRIVPGSHIMEFTLEDSPFGLVLVLDDTVFGILDTRTLG